MPTAMDKYYGGAVLTSFTNLTKLNSLPNADGFPLGKVTNGSNYPNAEVWLNIELPASMVAGGTIDVYFMGSLDDTVWTDDIDPDEVTTEVVPSMFNSTLIKTLKADDGMAGTDAAIWVCNDLAFLIGDIPPYWTLIVVNSCGQTLDASGHTGEYRHFTYSS